MEIYGLTQMLPDQSNKINFGKILNMSRGGGSIRPKTDGRINNNQTAENYHKAEKTLCNISRLITTGNITNTSEFKIV